MLLLLLSFSSLLESATVKVGGDYGWSIAQLAPIKAVVGDVLEFNYFYIHDVYQMTGDNCDFVKATSLAGPQESPFLLQLTKPGEFWFSCSTGDHCQRGQKVQVLVEPNQGQPSCKNDPNGMLKRLGMNCEVLTRMMSGNPEADDICSAERMGIKFSDVCPCNCKETKIETGVETAPASVAAQPLVDTKKEVFCTPRRCDMNEIKALMAVGRDPEALQQFMGGKCKEQTSAACKGLVRAVFACQIEGMPGKDLKPMMTVFLPILSKALERMFNLNLSSEEAPKRQREDELFSGSNGDGLTSEERAEFGLPPKKKAEPVKTKPVASKQQSKSSSTGSKAQCSEPTPLVNSRGKKVMEVNCRSAAVPMKPGEVVDIFTTLVDPYPTDRPVAVEYSKARLENEDGQEVSLRDVYVHHIVGTLDFGAGAEDVRTPFQPFPEPYVIINNPRLTGSPYANLHLINTVGVSDDDLLPCIECKCPEGFGTENGDDGGIICCSDCDSSSTASATNYYLLYTVHYRDITNEDIPVMQMAYNAHTQVEFDIPKLGEGKVYTLDKIARADYSMKDVENYEDDEELKVLRVQGHQHIGGIGLRIEDPSTGEVFSKMDTIYGTGKTHELGNETGYLVDMTTTNFFPPKPLKRDSKVRIVSDYDASIMHTGVMALMQVYYVGKRSDIKWPENNEAAFQFEPCPDTTPAPIRALHVVDQGKALLWMGPSLDQCVEGQTYAVYREELNGEWVEQARNLVDPMYALPPRFLSPEKFVVVAVSAEGDESDPVSIRIKGKGKGKGKKGQGKKNKGKGKGKGKNINRVSPI